MKKQKITILLLTMALCASAASGGCAAGMPGWTEPNQSTVSQAPLEEAKDSGASVSSDGASPAQACENDEVLSSEEQARAEKERRAEIAEKYSVYTPYGMTYDVDVFSWGEKTAFETGLKQSSDADFHTRTQKQEALQAELKKAGITAESGSFEQGDPDWRDDSLDAYSEFGVSYDRTSGRWMYGQTPVYILYDRDHCTFCDKGAEGGVSLNVVRDKDGNIEKLVLEDREELEQFVK